MNTPDLTPFVAVMETPLLIPVIGIIMGCAIPMVAMIVDYRKKRSLYELHHRERMAAIEKGLEMPPLPPDLLGSEPKGPSQPRFLLRGLIWCAVGIGMLIALPQLADDEVSRLGAIPLAVGIAYLIYYATEGRKLAASEQLSETLPRPPVS